ncbi:uncharacterized protein LOC132304294 [Cornus florida]|uniref:uncharacterized protein LOC132304294 n=1 Tax=Cornus florida TaxID=4283 RepID=UPI0028A29C8D|nr:uncharacterized protein LOC132304294 [Cornus florida]
MGFLNGILQRPVVTGAVVTAAAVAIASVSTNFHDKLQLPKSPDICSFLEQLNPSVSDSLQETKSSWVSNILVSKLTNFSLITRVSIPFPNVNHPIPSTGCNLFPKNYSASIAPSPVLLNLYQSAELAKSPKPTAYNHASIRTSSSSSEGLYRWHLPEPNAVDISGNSDCSAAKTKTVVVLLGWLGSKQKHLKRYAEWYTSRGYHAITFTFPMAEILNYQVGGKAEEHIDLLVNHLADWLEEEYGENLVFHTFSNTGWLTYGVILEKFQQQQDPTLMGRIRGCIVDSAPVAVPDPQVWASGFSAAFLKKHSIATKGSMSAKEAGDEVSVGTKSFVEAKPAVTEAALLLVLEKFFGVVLNLPTVNRRLSDVLGLLTSGQPSCPQLYIYSSADRVIPAGSVESFIEEQRKTGREVRACNFISTPHVDHFRNDPNLYTSQLTQFLENCVLTCCKS